MTSPLPEQGRQAAHIMLDCMSAWDKSAADDTNTAALNLALARLNDVEAVVATMHDDDTLDLDIDYLAGGVLVSMLWLVTRLAEARDVDRSEIVADLREFIDGHSG